MKSTGKNHHFIVALMLLFCFSSESVFGQEWEKVFPKTPIGELIQTSDSSLWLSSYEKDNYTILKLDKNGNTIFQKNTPYSYGTTKPTIDNSIVYISRIDEDNKFPDTTAINKMDKDGNIVWSKIYNFNYFANPRIEEMPNQQLLIVCADSSYIFSKSGDKLLSAQTTTGFIQPHITKVTSKSIFLAAVNGAQELIELEYNYNLNLIKSILISKASIWGSNWYEEGFPTLKLDDGSNLILAYDDALSGIELKKSLNGNIIWTKKIIKWTKNNNYSVGYQIKVDNQKNIVVIGEEFIDDQSLGLKSNAIIWVFDQNGNIKSAQRFNGTARNYLTHLQVTNDDYYIASGFKNEKTGINIGNGLYPDAFLVKTKAEGLNSFISGKIAIEKNTNCKADSLEQKLSGFVVESEDSKKVKSYAVSDQNGDYWLIAPSGTNTLSVQNPSPYFKQICDSTVVAKSGLSVEKDLMMSVTDDCPYMSVELSTQGIRPCTTAVYVVRYCNKGTVLGKNASIKVKLDPNLTYKTSTKTGVLQADGSYLFALGDVAINECGVFTITSDVKCDLNLVGKTLCNKANIYPDSICGGGNKAKIQVTGTCNAGKVDFLIKNIGKSAMPATKDYYVIEDDVMYKQGTFQLNPNATFPVSITAKAGKTYRIIAGQTDLTLGTIASTALEACVSNPNGNSTGFINQFPLGDDSPFEDEDCRTVVNSFDPNDKTAFPEGTKTQHFIPKNTDLDYLIRFQNSGTDTAFVVVIKDTLSAFLDPATIVPGVSSHPYRFTLTDKGVASFIFEKINLPHEKVDKEGSNGFVKFKIKQRPNNPNGTVINNHAAIFFDFNLPIITNTTANTIGENWIQILTGSKDHENNLIALKIYPNPFQENARIEIEENTYNNLIFNVLDLNGKILRSEKFDGNSLNFERGNLTEGFYMYQVMSESKILQTGKMIVN